jgi:hypothetical protein
MVMTMRHGGRDAAASQLPGTFYESCEVSAPAVIGEVALLGWKLPTARKQLATFRCARCPIWHAE